MTLSFLQSNLHDARVQYTIGNNNGVDKQAYNGFQVGLGIPLLFGGKQSTIKATRLEKSQVEMDALGYRTTLGTKLQSLLVELEKRDGLLTMYEQTGQALADELVNVANQSFQSGEIDFFQYIQTIDRGVGLQINYLKSLNDYNQTVLEINYLTNE